MATLTDGAFKGVILIKKIRCIPGPQGIGSTCIWKQTGKQIYANKESPGVTEKKMVQQAEDRSLKKSSLGNIQSYMPSLPKCGHLFSVFKFESSASVIRIFSDSLINHLVPLVNTEQESMDSITLLIKLSPLLPWHCRKQSCLCSP